MQSDLKLSLQLAELEAQAQTILAPRFDPQIATPRQRMWIDLVCDEKLFGGQAGGGKSSAILKRALKYVDVPGYAAIIFRRTLTDLKLAGALLDRSHHWLTPTPARWNGDSKRWTFPSGATLSFGYLEHENDKYRYQSAEFQFCVERGTKIIMADGSLKPIEEIQSGDSVKTLLGPRLVKSRFEIGLRPCVEVVTPTARCVVSETHRLLTPDGWVSPLELLSKQSHDDDILNGASPSSFRDYRPRSGSRLLDLRQASALAQLSPLDRTRLGILSSSAAIRNDSAASDDERQVRDLPPMWSGLATLLARALPGGRLSAGGECLPRAPFHAQSGYPSRRDYDAYCRAGHGFGDERFLRAREFGREYIRPRDDAERQNRPSYPDNRARIPSRNHRASTFAHPYTNLLHESREDVSSIGIRMRPVGEREVYDLRVEQASHYISSGGIIHANCGFDELSQFTDTQYLYLFSRLRRPAMPCATCQQPLEMILRNGVWIHEDVLDPEDDHVAQPDPSKMQEYPRSAERNLTVFDIPLEMGSGTNPGGIGAEWVRDRFIPDDFMPEDAIEPKIWVKSGIGSDEKPFKTHFVPSRLEDNPFADRKSYERMLGKLGRVEYAQLAKGDWTIAAVGRMRFDADSIAKFTPRRGTDGELFIDSDSKGTIPGVPPIFFRPQEGGATSIWKAPERGHLYAAGADTAEGKDANKGQGTAKGDWSVCQIRDADSGEQVARFRGRVRERAFAVQLWMILTWYNRAFLVPEIGGGYGRAMLDHLVLDLMYPMAHIYRRSGNTAGASPLNIEIDDLGWPTGATTRPRLVSALDTAILTHSIETYDPITLNEYRSFEVSKAGKDEARTGTHDDAVMADALCVIGIQEFPPMLRRAQALTRPQIVKYAVPQGNAAQMEAQRLMDERRRRM